MKRAISIVLATAMAGLQGWSSSVALAEVADSTPSIPLSRALSQVAAKHHLQLMYVSSVTEGKYVANIPETQNAADSLQDLLKNTGLRYEFINSRMVRIYSAPMVRLAAERQLLAAGDASTAAAPRAAADTTALEEIVVTAERRGENLQTVPIAVTAATSEALEQMGVGGSLNIPVVAPSVTFSSSVGGSRITIRGIGSTGSLGDESANAVYIDGVYLPSLPSLLLSFNNIERLEILKGPQGTLFGRNASGGVIQIVTKKPSADAQLKVMAGYGNYNTTEGSLYGTMGVAPTLAADLAVYVQDQQDGWGHYLATGHDAYNGKSRTARTSWLWTPSDATSLRLSVIYGKNQAPTNRGGQIIEGERVPAPGNIGNVGFYNSSADFEQDYQVKQWNYSLNFSQDMGWAKLVNITSRDEVTAHQNIDNNNAPGSNQTVFERYSNTWTEELQLQSSEASKVSWIVGGFYYSNAQGLNPALTRTATGGLARELRAFMDTDSWAGFGQATIPIVANTKLTLGARYTHDNHEINGTIQTAASLTVQPNKSQADSKATYRVALDHQFTDSLMSYVSYSSGFKSGFYSMTSPLDPSVRPQTVDAYEVGLKSELLDRRVRLNAAAFYYKFDDIQVRLVGANSQISFFNAAAGEVKGLDVDMEASLTRNFSMRLAGTYLSSKYTDFSNALLYHVDPVSLALIRDPGGSAKGNDLINAPKWVGTIGADYSVPVSFGTFNFDASYNYNDGFFFDAQNRLKQPAYGLLSGSVAYLTPAEHWRVRLYGNNLTGEKYYSNVDITDGVGDIYWPSAPRTYGAQVSYSFK